MSLVQYERGEEETPLPIKDTMSPKQVIITVTEDLELAIARFTANAILRAQGDVDHNTWEDGRGYAVDITLSLLHQNPEIWDYVEHMQKYSVTERSKR